MLWIGLRRAVYIEGGVEPQVFSCSSVVYISQSSSCGHFGVQFRLD